MNADTVSYISSPGQHAEKLGEESSAPTIQTVSRAQDSSPSLTQPQQRKGAQQAAQPSPVAAPELSPDPAASSAACPPDLPSQVTHVTIAPALQAASFQTLPLRFVCAVGIAAAATSFDWFMPGIALPVQVMVANVVLMLSAAWMLKKDPERCQRILQQVQVRQGKGLDWMFGIVSKISSVPVWCMQVFFTVGWALYVDSGTYVAAAIVFYLLNGTSVAPPTFSDTPAE